MVRFCGCIGGAVFIMLYSLPFAQKVESVGLIYHLNMLFHLGSSRLLTFQRLSSLLGSQTELGPIATLNPGCNL
jgi:hypothetical protein